MRKYGLVCLSMVLVVGWMGIVGAEEAATAPEVAVTESAAPAPGQNDAVQNDLFAAEGCQQQDPTGEQIFASIPDPGCQLNPGTNCNFQQKNYCDTFCGANCSICQANGCCICTVCQWP